MEITGSLYAITKNEDLLIKVRQLLECIKTTHYQNKHQLVGNHLYACFQEDFQNVISPGSSAGSEIWHTQIRECAKQLKEDGVVFALFSSFDNDMYHEIIITSSDGEVSAYLYRSTSDLIEYLEEHFSDEYEECGDVYFGIAKRIAELYTYEERKQREDEKQQENKKRLQQMQEEKRRNLQELLNNGKIPPEIIAVLDEKKEMASWPYHKYMEKLENDWKSFKWRKSLRADYSGLFGRVLPYIEADTAVCFPGASFAFSGIGICEGFGYKEYLIHEIQKRGGMHSKKLVSTTNYLVVHPIYANEKIILQAIDNVHSNFPLKIITDYHVWKGLLGIHAAESITKKEAFPVTERSEEDMYDEVICLIKETPLITARDVSLNLKITKAQAAQVIKNLIKKGDVVIKASGEFKVVKDNNT